MSLLSICTAACNIAPIAAPTSIVGNSDQTALLLLALANQAGQEIARRPQGGWISMIRFYEWTTVFIPEQAGTVSNSGPGGVAVITGLSDTSGIVPYQWMASGTGLPSNAVIIAVTSDTVTINQPVDATGIDALAIGLPPGIGIGAIGGGLDLTGEYQFRQALYPVPADFERAIDNTFWDRTLYWQMRGPMSPQQWQVYKSSMIGNATIQRRFQFQRAAGQLCIAIDPPPFTQNARLVFEYVSNAYCESALGVAQTQWTADTDVGVVNEYLIQLGVTQMLLRRLGLSYSDEMARYERELSKAMATDGASAILNLTLSSGAYLLGPWSVQDGYFPSMPVGGGLGVGP